MSLLKTLAENYVYLFYCLAAFVLSMILTWQCIIFLPKLGYVDKPGGRHIHQKATPRGGGIAIIISFFLVQFIALLILKDQTKLWHMFFLFLLALPLVLLSILDDRFELISRCKLVVQIFIAGGVWFVLDPQITLHGWHIHPFITLIATVIWIIFVVNAFNLVDGLDGLASGLTIISLLGFTALFCVLGQNQFFIFETCLLIAAILGFFVFNFHPAKIFLGDTGSTFLGFAVAIASIRILEYRPLVWSSFILPLLLVGIPLIDVLLAIWRRFVRKILDSNSGGIMEGDKDHLHHRLMRQFNGSQKLAVGTLYLYDSALVAFAICFQRYGEKIPGVGFALLAIFLLIVFRVLGVIEVSDSKKLVRQVESIDNRWGLMYNMLHPLFDNVEILISYLVASGLVFKTLISMIHLLCLWLPVSLFMGIRHIRRINWIRGGIQNYVKLMLTLTIGTFVGCIVGYCYIHFSSQESSISLRNYCIFSLLFYMFNLILILLERFVLYYVETFWKRNHYLKKKIDGYKRILVYGGGIQCKILITYLYSTTQSEMNVGIIGIIDDDISLKNMMVFGFPVLGTSAEIEAIYQKHQFDKIILTISEEDSEQERKLCQFCKNHNLEIEHMFLNFVPCLSATDSCKSAT